MKAHLSSILVAALLIVSSSSANAEEILCVKQKVRVKNSKVKLARFIKTASSTCPRGYSAVQTSNVPADILAALLTVDGSGSTLDADTIDGIDSASLATSASVSSSISSLQTAYQAADTSLQTAYQAADTSLDTRLDTAETNITNLQDETSIENVIRVGTDGGDYTSLSDAIASISGSSAANPFHVKLGPGVFSLATTLTIPAGVHVSGVSQRGTIIRGSFEGGSLYSGFIRLSSGSSLSDLTVDNTATSGFVNGIYLDGVSETSPNIPSSISTRIENVFINSTTAGAATQRIGIIIEDADVYIRNTDIYIDGAGSSNIGVALVDTGAYTYLDNLNIRCQGGTNNSGFLAIGGTGKITNSNIFGNSQSVSLSGSASAEIAHSYLSSTAGIAINLSNTSSFVARYSTIDTAFGNLSSTSSGTVQCSYTTDESFNELDSGCS